MNRAASITPEMKKVLKRLRLSPILETLPERLELARQQKLSHAQLLQLVFAEEVERRDSAAAQRRVEKGKLDRQMQLHKWDETARVTYDHALWSDLCSLRFLDSHHHVLILGPVGVGKTFMAAALGHIACRRGYSVLMERTERVLKRLKASRLDNSYDTEMRRLIALDLLILDDFALDHMDSTESRDIYEIVLERHRRASIVVTSNRDPAEWLATMSDPIRAQSAVDRLQNAAYELVVEGESYRKRERPTLRPRIEENEI